MQTLKTAIVVVLLLTVTYSAYVALTAPPAEVPAGLAEILKESENGSLFNPSDIDTGIPDIFGGDSMLPPPLDSASGDLAADPALPPPSAANSFGGALADTNSARVRMTDESQGSIAKPPADLSFNDPKSIDASIAVPDALPSGNSFALPGTDTAPSNAGSAAGGNANPTTPNLATNPSQTKPTAPNPVSASSAALVNAIATADRQSSQQQLREALTTLSLFYNTPDLTKEQREPLLARLDFLAGEVVYSSQHLMEQPHRVRQGETMQSIAASLEVPWQLLATINQIADPAAIVPGTELKVLRGPFRAEVNLSRSELTVFLGELYAGRFPIQVGSDPAPQPGSYSILSKQSERTYYPLAGANIPGNDPRNPYGDVWLDLGNQMSIHGSPQQASSMPTGCIQLRANDAHDVFGILSQGSAVSVLR